MTSLVVLDAEAFDVVSTVRGSSMRALLQRTAERGGRVSCAAVTLAEVCRGSARTRKAEAALAQIHGGQRIRVVSTDERLAKLVGAILHHVGHGSDRLADAHVVAICASFDEALVLTEDPDDIAELAAALPGCRIVSRRPDTPL